MRCKTVAFLLRLNFLGADERSDFWREYPPDIYVLPNRPSFFVFTKDEYICPSCKKSLQVAEGEPAPACKKCMVRGIYKGKKYTHSDATEYAWFVYGEERQRTSGKLVMLNSTPKEVRKAAVQKLKMATNGVAIQG